MRRALAVAAALVIVAALAQTIAAAAAGDRRALVIGNSKYLHTAPLRNPINDATLIANKLRELGFQVRLETDIDAKRFAEIISNFASTLQRDFEVLFYYAGHGLQFRGQNFLVGIDATLKSEAALQNETFRLYRIVSLLEQKAGTTLLFWDACRENPLAEELTRIVASSEASPRLEPELGAAPLPPRRGDTYIVYSAETGKKALDGNGDFSPFAASLARHIATPDLEIDKLFQRVTREVQEQTRQFQSPERLTKLTHDYFFRREKIANNDEEVSRALRAPLSPVEKRPIIIIPSRAC